MPYRLDTHVLTVDANVIHKVDTANPANLYSMWTGEYQVTAKGLAHVHPADWPNPVFSRCADSVEQGRRLENLSWRLWQKEQLVETDDKTASAANSTCQTAPQNIPSDIRQINDVPQLSGSVESVADDETVEFTSVSAPLEIVRPRIRRQDSSTSSRSRRDRHTSSDDIEKMIVSIVKDKAPLSAPTQTKSPVAPPKTMAVQPSPQTIYRSGSTTTESASPSKNSDLHSDESHPSPEIQPRTSTTVIRGFSPSQQPTVPRTVQPTLQQPTSDAAIPEPTSAPAPKMVRTGKQPAAFALGASYSSSEQGQSVETRQPVAPPAVAFKKNAIFKLGGSSEEEGSLKSALHSSRASAGLSAQKKQASFSNHVVTHTMEPDNAIESDSEVDYIDESAIDDDDDSSDWEDSIEDSGKSSVDEKYFQRVDSKANLTSRRSLITLMLAKTTDERARKLGNHASQSTSAISHAQAGRQGSALGASPNDSDDAPLMMKSRQQQLKPIKEIPRSTAQPIAMPTRSNVQGQGALSPRTTRRNMLATELTESLRRHLLWERSQKSSTANAVLKRRHTSHDVANLKQYPERPCMKKSEDVNSGSFNQFFSKESFEGYHAKGW